MCKEKHSRGEQNTGVEKDIAYHAHSLELGTVGRAVVLGIVTEDGGSVEGAVIFWEV